MFNRTIINESEPPIRFPNTINVHEHKAPTDESVRLLNEMEQKAQENLIYKFSSNQDNTLHFDFQVYKLATLTPVAQEVELFLLVRFNGKQYYRKVRMHKRISFQALADKNCPLDLKQKFYRFLFIQFLALLADVVTADGDLAEAARNFLNEIDDKDAATYDFDFAKMSDKAEAELDKAVVYELENNKHFE